MREDRCLARAPVIRSVSAPMSKTICTVGGMQHNREGCGSLPRRRARSAARTDPREEHRRAEGVRIVSPFTMPWRLESIHRHQALEEPRAAPATRRKGKARGNCFSAVGKDWISGWKRASVSLRRAANLSRSNLEPRHTRQAGARASEGPRLARLPVTRKVPRCSTKCPKRSV